MSFLPVGKLLVKEHYHFKRKSFFAFAACELSRYSPLVHSFKKSKMMFSKMKKCAIILSQSIEFFVHEFS